MKGLAGGRGVCSALFHPHLAQLTIAPRLALRGSATINRDVICSSEVLDRLPLFVVVVAWEKRGAKMSSRALSQRPPHPPVCHLEALLLHCLTDGGFFIADAIDSIDRIFVDLRRGQPVRRRVSSATALRFRDSEIVVKVYERSDKRTIK